MAAGDWAAPGWLTSWSTSRRQTEPWEWLGSFETSKPTSCNTPHPTRPPLLILPSHFHHLPTKYSNLWAYGGCSHSNSHRVLTFLPKTDEETSTGCLAYIPNLCNISYSYNCIQTWPSLTSNVVIDQIPTSQVTRSGFWCNLVPRLFNHLFVPKIPRLPKQASTVVGLQLQGRWAGCPSTMTGRRYYHRVRTAQALQRSFCWTLISNHWQIGSSTGRTLLPSGGHIGLWSSLKGQKLLPCEMKTRKMSFRGWAVMSF